MKKTIAIIAGGDSSEHDVSLRSAEGINSWIDKEKYDVYTIEIKGLNWEAHLSDDDLSACVGSRPCAVSDGFCASFPDNYDCEYCLSHLMVYYSCHPFRFLQESRLASCV